jgi:glycosyltransferase involved in cell wall biosynthesis
MAKDSVSVTLAVGLAPYQKTLASSLLRSGMLRRVFYQGLYLDVQEPNDAGSLKTIRRFSGYRFSTRAVWAVWRRLPRSVRPRPPITFNVWLADRLLANWIVPSTIFHGCTASCLSSLRAAKRQGSVTLVENASRHPRHWKQSEVEECQHLGVEVDSGDNSGNSSERLLLRRDREFETCDRIVVPSTVARRSFAEMGYAHKTEVVALGVDAEFFRPKHEDRPSSTMFRACFVGRVEAAKGVGYLLQAWKRLALPHAELVLVGEVRPEMESWLKTYANCNVRRTGYLSPLELARCYQESSLLVLPSPNEGFGMVLLEAMASGLPTIGTDMTGAVDCMENGKEGLIVPSQDADALADALWWCYRHPEERKAMGQAARIRIESEFTLEHYNQRMMALYRSLVP